MRTARRGGARRAWFGRAGGVRWAAAAARGLVLLGAGGVLSLTGCMTSQVMRAATGGDAFEHVTAAWALPDGGLALDLQAAPGTFAFSDCTVVMTGAQLAEAHRTQGVYVLEHAALRPADEVRSTKAAPVLIVQLARDPEWGEELMSEMGRRGTPASRFVACRGKRPPRLSTAAAGGGVRKLRFVHVRRGDAAGSGPPGLAFIELAAPDEGGGSWTAVPFVPIALACDAAVAALFVAGVVVYVGLAILMA